MYQECSFFFQLLLLKMNLVNIRNMSYSFSCGIGTGVAELHRFIVEARTSGSSGCEFYSFCFCHFFVFVLILLF